MRGVALILIATAAFAGRATADDFDPATCIEKHSTPEDCWNAVRTIAEERKRAAASQGAAAPQPTKAEVTETVADGLKESNPGTDLAGSGGGASRKDFLARFASALEIGGLSEDGKAVHLDLADLLDKSHDGLKLELILRDAELSEAVRKALPDDVPSDTLKGLENELEFGDDAEVVFSWSPGGRKFGRDIRAHRDLFQVLFDQLLDGFSPQERIAEADGMAWIDTFPRRHGTKVEGYRFGEGSLSLEHEKTWIRLIALSAERNVAYVSAVEQAARQSRLEHFYQLVDNQPQFDFSGTYRRREDLAGVDELGLKVSYSLTFGNVNGLVKECGLRAEDGSGEVRTTNGDGERALDCYAAWMDPEGAKAGSASRGGTLEFHAELARSSGLDLVDPPDGVTLHLDDDSKLTMGLTYGQYLTLSGARERRGRLDLALDFETHSTGSERNDRSVARLTYSHLIQKASDGDGLALVLGVVYANKPEFLDEEDVDDELKTTVGIKYRFVGAKDLGL